VSKRQWFTKRSAEGTTSPAGLTLQLMGAGAVLIGLYLVYPPLAFLVGGLGAILIGEKL
jgi:hypothetical protein